jgi:glycosyltransferase involved in cell wall biosynthesis
VYRVQPNGGAASAVNHGIRVARGRYIAIHNADDVCLPTRLEEEAAVLDGDPEVEMVYSQALFFLGTGRPLRLWGGPPCPLSPEQTFYRLYEDENFIPNPSVMFKRRHLTDDQPFPERYRISEDYIHHLRVAHDYPIHCIERPLVKIRHDDEHEHLMGDVEGMFRADRAVHRQIYEEFRLRSPRITWRRYAGAERNQCIREASFYLESGRYGLALRRLVEASGWGPLDGRLPRLFLMAMLKPVVPAPAWQATRKMIRKRRALPSTEADQR